MPSTVLTPAFAAHLDRTPGMYAALAGPDLRPETARVLYAAAEPGSDVVRFLISAAGSDRFLADAKPAGRACLVAAALADYETLQFKGSLLEVRDADADELAGLKRYLDAFCGLVAHVGIDPDRYRAHLDVGPYKTLRIAVDAVFDQTPREGAGSLVSRAGGQ